MLHMAWFFKTTHRKRTIGSVDVCIAFVFPTWNTDCSPTEGSVSISSSPSLNLVLILELWNYLARRKTSSLFFGGHLYACFVCLCILRLSLQDCFNVQQCSGDGKTRKSNSLAGTVMIVTPLKCVCVPKLDCTAAAVLLYCKLNSKDNNQFIHIVGSCFLIAFHIYIYIYIQYIPYASPEVYQV